MTVAAEASPSDLQRNLDAPAQLERLVGVGAAWKLVGQIGVQGIRLVTVAILARLLAPADYGAAAIAITLAAFAPTVADMGMGSALVQTEAVTRLVRSTAFWSSVAFGVGLSALFAVSAAPVGTFVGDPQVGTMFAVGGLTFAICSLGSTSQAVFIRRMNFRGVELRFWLAILLASAVAIAAAGFGAGPWALVLQQITLLATFVASLWWRSSWRPTLDFSGAVFRQLASFAIRIAGGRWARLIELVVLSMLIGRLAGVPALGAFTFAMSTVILPLTVVAVPIGEVLFSAFSRLRGERERMAGLWLESVRFLAAAILPLLAGLVVVAPDLIPVVFGSQWRVSVAIIQILSAFVMIRCLQAFNSVVMDAVGRPQVTLWTQLAALCLTPVAVILGAQWSVEGVAICYVISQLIAVEIPVFILVLSELRVSARTVAAQLSGVAAATLVMATTCLLGRHALLALGMNATGRAAITLALGLLAYALCLRWLAPDICRRVVGLVRRLAAKVIGARRRSVAGP